MSFLSKFSEPFKRTRLKSEILKQLLSEAEVIELESDDMPFSHRTDKLPILEQEPDVHSAQQQKINSHIRKYEKRKEQEEKRAQLGNLI